MLDSYHELLGILEKVEISKLGEVNQTLEELDKAADSFLESYDIDHNETVSIFEIIEAKNRKKLAEDLNKKGENQLHRIVEAMKKLEGEVTKYRQGSTDQTTLKVKSKVKRKAKQEEVENKSEEVIAETDNNPETAINMDEKEQIEENYLIAQIEVPPKVNK